MPAMTYLKYILISFLLLNILSANTPNKELVVVTKVSPPFSMKSKSGEWSGISIDLWKEIASRLNYKYVFEETTLDGMLNRIKNREADVAISALTVTADREKYIDFTQSYFITNLSIVIPKGESSLIESIFDKLFSFNTLLFIIGIFVTLLFAAFAFWYTEKNSMKQKSVTYGESLWWACVTMTTVGYGDTTPSTFLGRIVAVAWMFLSMFLVAGLIAASASFLSDYKSNYFIKRPSDLSSGTIGCVDSSIADLYLKSRHIYPENYVSIDSGIEAVKLREIDAFVYDEAILRYIIDSKYSKSVELTDSRFKPQNYSIALQEGSNLREDINRVLLGIIESSKWNEIKSRYFLKQRY